MKKYEEAYSEILEVLDKHKDLCLYDIDRLTGIADNHLAGLKLKHEYGFDINPDNIDDWNSRTYQQLGRYDYIKLVNFKENTNMSISWEDNGLQPKNEVLLKINFPTGAYIFDHDVYDIETFDLFFEELKSYVYKYIDSTNHSIYYPIEIASKVFNEFGDIFKKYMGIFIDKQKKMKVERLKKELNLLENGNE